MEHTNFSLVDSSIRKLNINISDDIPDEMGLHMECEAELKHAVDEKNKSKLLSVKYCIHDDDSEKFVITIESNNLFSYQEEFESSEQNDILQNILLPIAQKRIFMSLDNILETMGYPRLNIG